MGDQDACGNRDYVTGAICTRGKGHPGSHMDEPGGRSWGVTAERRLWGVV